MYYVENSHEPIIEREIFERVQTEIARRRELGIFANPRVKTNCFTGKIVCAQCEKNTFAAAYFQYIFPDAGYRK